MCLKALAVLLTYWFPRLQSFIDSAHKFDPASLVVYYVDKASKKKCVIAGNHRIAAKKVVQARVDQKAHFDVAPDLRIAVVKVSSDIDPRTVLEASARTRLFLYISL